MKCPFCKSEETKVIDKRETSDGISRRRRECENCDKRFTTYERVEQPELIVVKKDGRREKFDREKLVTGIRKACEKRPVSTEKIDIIVNSIEEKLRAEAEGKEVKSGLIGELVMRALKKLDKVAYIRFASVYRDFKDIEQFNEEIKRLK